MSLSEATLNGLRELVEKNLNLRIQLQQATCAAESAHLLALAAADAGLSADEEALRQYLESTAQKMADQALSDAQLDQVAGGMSKEGYIALSIFTFGTGCAIMSIKSEITKATGVHKAGGECWS